jgi:hypothetical protein
MLLLLLMRGCILVCFTISACMASASHQHPQWNGSSLPYTSHTHRVQSMHA